MAVIDFNGYRRSAGQMPMNLEPLTRNDMANLRRAVWAITPSSANNYRQGPWVQGVWEALRRATGRVSPAPFTVADIPVISAELRRLVAASRRFQDAVRKAEARFLARAVRAADEHDPAVRQIEEALMVAQDAAFASADCELAPWLGEAVADFAARRPARPCDHLDMTEPADGREGETA